MLLTVESVVCASRSTLKDRPTMSIIKSLFRLFIEFMLFTGFMLFIEVHLNEI